MPAFRKKGVDVRKAVRGVCLHFCAVRRLNDKMVSVMIVLGDNSHASRRCPIGRSSRQWVALNSCSEKFAAHSDEIQKSIYRNVQQWRI